MPKKKIFIVEDSKSMRHALCAVLETEDFTVCGNAANGVEAIEKAQRVQPDLVVLDLSMPVMSGAEAAPLLKKLMPTVPVVLFTMHEDLISKAFLSAIHVDRVVAKPDGLTELIICMRDVLKITDQGPNQGSGNSARPGHSY